VHQHVGVQHKKFAGAIAPVDADATQGLVLLTVEADKSVG